MTDLEVQPVVRLKAASLCALGDAWLAGLPELVAELEERWSVTVDRSLPGGTAAYVGLAHSAAGLPVVIKVSVPDPDFADEIGTLERAQGRGYVRLLAHDIGRGAMLLEALGPAMTRMGLAPESQIRILCRLLANAWAVPVPESGTVAEPFDKATALDRLVRRLWSQLDRPCSEQVVAEALECARRRAAAFDPDRCVMVHGDAAPANALQVLAPRAGAETGYVFVDPDGFVGDPAYDLGVALRDWCPELLATPNAVQTARRFCGLLAAGSGLDEQSIWEWGFLERVSTGLYALAMGAEELSAPFFATAERLLRG